MRLTQAVHAQQALLFDGLDGNEVHVRAASGLADGGRIVGVVLAGLALQAVRGHQMGGDDARVQTHGTQAARPVVGAGTGLHGDEAAGCKLSTPGKEFVAREGAAGDPLATGIDSVNLKDTLGQIDTDPCNLAHGTSPSNMGFRLTSKTNLGTSMPSPGSGKSLRIR